MAGLVPAISTHVARPCLPKRDRRDKPGDDDHLRHLRWSFRGACTSTRTRNPETSIVPASGFRVRRWRAVPEW